MNFEKLWWNNKYINPRTNKRIKKNGPVYKKYLKRCLKFNLIKDNYHEYHNNYVDPLLLVDLPLEKNKPVFKYPYFWDAMTGEIIGKDPRGPLYFDPDTLIYYFYTKRLNKLWIESKENYGGTYDDGLGLGKKFYRRDIGYNPQWYLFRLPLHDGNYNGSLQQTTIAPELTFSDIERIYFLSLQYDNFYERFKIERPNLIHMYNLYHQAIKKPEFNIDDLGIISEDIIKEQYYYFNRKAVNNLKNL